MKNTDTKREMIDRQRDFAYVMAETLGQDEPVLNAPPINSVLADALFAYYCTACAMQETGEKANWYIAMAKHALALGPDPREGQPGFQPYQRMRP